ncbi:MULTISPECIES: hypothetical protein [unclassified Desulfovibrio]|uniref:hypothetical protein n=1 Tax=unclassified Desulfovibrio TaxID=2593640 RepID=UPI0013E9C9E7|nr:MULTISPECIES: hypothetical protein [unclassified Desulfovibrio]
MTDPLCIRLPFLRGPLPEGLDQAAAGMPGAPGALRLWPGHRPPGGEVPPGWHAPDGYPFGHAEAAALLAAFGSLDARDLEGARDAADRAQQERRARELGEMADLAAFAESPGEGRSPRHKAGAPVPARIAAEQAQKLLLWLWLQEERLAELASLAAGCARGLGRLARGFGEEASARGEEAAGEPALALHAGLVPPWRPAVASAAVFVSGEAVFFVEGPMREELLDRLDFRPAPEWGERLGCAPEDAARVVAAEAPLWRALGRQRPGGQAELRVWITWGRP